MTVISTILWALGFALNLYMFLCMARILLSWFPGLTPSGATRLVEKATDPYLSLWRRIPFLQSGGMDFSPIFAIAVLIAASRVFTMASMGVLTIGGILALVVSVLWSPVAFVLGFFALLMLARMVAYIARWNSLHPIWRAIDAMINPVLWRIKRFIYGDRIVNYMQGLITGTLVLAGARALLGLAVGALMRLLQTF